MARLRTVRRRQRLTTNDTGRSFRRRAKYNEGVNLEPTVDSARSRRHGNRDANATARQVAGLRAVHRPSAPADAAPDQDHRHRDGVPDAAGGVPGGPVPRGRVSTTSSGCRSGCGGRSWSPAWSAAGVYSAFRHRDCRWCAGSTRSMRPRRSRSSEPAFKNSLINYLDLRRHRGQIVQGGAGHARVPGGQRPDPGGRRTAPSISGG